MADNTNLNFIEKKGRIIITYKNGKINLNAILKNMNVNELSTIYSYLDITKEVVLKRIKLQSNIRENG